MTTDTEKKFHDLLEGFDTAMLVTQATGGQLRARPMAIAKVDSDNGVWFMTQIESGKIDEIQTDSHVCVSFQGGKQYLSLSGRARIERDRAKIDELWNEAWKTWFPEGKDDPSLVLLHVVAQDGEYWDNSGAGGLKYMFKAGTAYLQGKRPEIDEDIHGKAKL